MPYRQSLRWRLLSFLAGIFLLTLLLIGAGVYWFISGNEQRTWQAHLQEAADNAGQAVATFIENKLDILRTVGMIESDELAANPEVLNNLIQQTPAFLEIIRLDNHGSLIATAHHDTPLLSNLFTIPQSNWFLQASSGQIYLGKVEITSASEPYQIIAVPAADGGVIAARLRMDILWELVANLNFGQTGQSYVVNQQNQIIAHTNPQITLANAYVEKIPQSGQDAPPGEAKYINFSGTPVMGMSATVPQIGWTVITEIEASESTQSSHSTLIFLNIVIFALAAPILFIGWQFLNHQIFSPMKSIHHGVKHISRGDLQYRIPETGRDEIGQVINAFNVMSSQLQEREVQLVNHATALSNEVAERKHAEKALETQKEMFQNLVEMAHVITSNISLEETLWNILQVAIRLTATETSGRSSLFLLDEHNQVTKTLIARDRAMLDKPSEFVQTVIQTGLAGWVIRNRRAALVFDTRHDERWFFSAQDSYTAQSALSVPIISNDQVVGVLSLTHPDLAHFTMAHADLLQAAASQMALALHNAQIYEEKKHLANRQQTLYETLRTIGGHLDPAQVTQAAVLAITQLTHWAAVEILLPNQLSSDGAGNSLVVKASQGVLASAEGESLLVGQGIIGKAYRTHTWQYAPDTTQNEDYISTNPAVRSELAIPIHHNEKVFGVLNVLAGEIDAFDQEDILMAISLADAIYLALDNAYLHKQLLEAKQAAETANQAKNEFISVVAHELKNPMTAIRGSADLLRRGAIGPVSPEQISFIDMILSSTSRLQALVSDLSDISRIETGNLNITPQAVSLHEILADSIQLLLSQIEAKEQKLDIQVPSDMPALWADPNRLSQVLTNLLSNAHKYTPKGGQITICASLSPASQDLVQISIADNGIGINTEDQQHLFNKFFRGNDAEKRKASGTGLGLNITRSLIELQGGRIWFESQYRQGTTFYFTIPLAPKQNQAATG